MKSVIVMLIRSIVLDIAFSLAIVGISLVLIKDSKLNIIDTHQQ